MADSDDRPKTASRPRTAARPTTAGGGLGAWEEDEEDSDEDVGMFSFARPQTGEQNNNSAASPSTTAPFTPYSTTSPYSANPFGFAPPPSVPPSTYAPSTQVPPTDTAISPAAAYALSMQSTTVASPAASARPQTALSSGFPRKRGSWQSPESPSHVVGNPYDDRLRREQSRRTSDGSSRDKIEAMASNWADAQRGTSYAYDENGQAIMLNELGDPIGPVTTREEKLIAEAQLGEYAEYAANVGGGLPGMVQYDDDDEDSPYPEVRASVSNFDDAEMPVLTFRSWSIGILFSIVISALNTFFQLRYPAPLITPVITQILSYPLGKLLAHLLPYKTWDSPRFLRRFGAPDEMSLNPGPFNIKEHTLIVIMANVATAPATALNFVLASDKYYGVAQGAGFDILLVLTTQMIGFGAAGLCHRILVWPAAMIWPQNLVFCTLLNTLHAEEEGNESGTSRYRFFTYAISAAFVWYWFPGWIFTALSAFSWVCWIAPNNVVVNQLFGVSSGLGMGLLTFDWSQIAYVVSPLIVPWWAEVNVFAAFVIAFWIIAPAMYYTNVWNSAYLPISTASVFDRFGSSYNTSAVVDSLSMSLNVTAYNDYSPLYLPITYATVYGVALMLSTAVIVHTALYHGKLIASRLKRVQEADDIHMKLMRAYPEVPHWWYGIFLAVATGLSIVTVACWDTQMPVWGVILAIIIGLIYLIPGGFIFAMTSYQLSISLISELFAGYIIRDRPLANMLFKIYSVQTLSTGLTFVQDLKFGHYMKIPPRATFAVQFVATFITAVVQVGVVRWLVSVVPDLCSPDQRSLLTCPYANVLYSSSIVWGLIGPARQFSTGKHYNAILYWLLAGAVLPCLTWLALKRFKKPWLGLINVPVALNGITYVPPASGINYSSWILVGFIFQYAMRRRHFQWWSKFTFILSAALDAGTVIAGIVIFLCLQLPKNGSIYFDWWGNNVYTNTLDWAGTSFKTPPPEGFGPTTW